MQLSLFQSDPRYLGQFGDIFYLNNLTKTPVYMYGNFITINLAGICPSICRRKLIRSITFISFEIFLLYLVGIYIGAKMVCFGQEWLLSCFLFELIKYHLNELERGKNSCSLHNFLPFEIFLYFLKSIT